MSFFETPRFPDCIALGARGGPTFFTELVSVYSGHEQRNQVWRYGRLKWEVGHVPRPAEDMHELIRFFRQMRGRLHGFRFKDHTDYQAESGGAGYVFASDGHPTGLPIGQLFKRYEDGTSAYDERVITKPVAGTVALLKDGVDQPTGWTLDTTTGEVTFTALASKTVTAITNANPAVVTATSHGFTNGQTIYLSAVTGMTEVNERAFEIGGVTTHTFTLVGEDATDYGVFSGTANASRYPQPAETWTWTGEYDTPCRFDTDEMQIHVIDKAGAGSLIEAWEPIPIVEIRMPVSAAEEAGGGGGGGGEEPLLGAFSAGFDEGFS